MPVSAWNASTTGFMTSMRVSSTHIVRVPVSAASVVAASGVGSAVFSAPLSPSLPQAVRVSASPSAAARAGMLRRIVCLLKGWVA